MTTRVSVTLPRGALWWCQDDTNVPDTDIKMPPIPGPRHAQLWTPWLSSGWEGDLGDKKYGKTKDISHNNRHLSSTKELPEGHLINLFYLNWHSGGSEHISHGHFPKNTNIPLSHLSLCCCFISTAFLIILQLRRYIYDIWNNSSGEECV